MVMCQNLVLALLLVLLKNLCASDTMSEDIFALRAPAKKDYDFILTHPQQSWEGDLRLAIKNAVAQANENTLKSVVALIANDASIIAIQQELPSMGPWKRILVSEVARSELLKCHLQIEDSLIEYAQSTDGCNKAILSKIVSIFGHSTRMAIQIMERFDATNDQEKMLSLFKIIEFIALSEMTKPTGQPAKAELRLKQVILVEIILRIDENRWIVEKLDSQLLLALLKITSGETIEMEKDKTIKAFKTSLGGKQWTEFKRNYLMQLER